MIAGSGIASLPAFYFVREALSAGADAGPIDIGREFEGAHDLHGRSQGAGR